MDDNSHQHETAYDYALRYLGQRVHSIPLPPKSKAPHIPGWQTLRLEGDELRKSFSNGCNLGILNGSASDGWADIDHDSDESLNLCGAYLRPTGRSFGRNCITTHDIYRVTSGDFGTKRFQDPNLGDDDAKAMLVELRGTGSQTMAPPSIHPNGQLIEWYAEGEPLIITYNELLKDVERLAAACLLARYWPKRGARHDAALALAGALAHAQWSVDDAVNFIDPIARYKGRSKENEVRDTFKRFAQDKQITGQPTCTAFFSERVWDSIRQWLHLQSPASVVTDWPDPEPLPVTLPSVAALKPSMLPDKLRPSIVDIAERAQAPLDFPAVAVIVALSSALGRRIGIYPKQHDSWLVIPNLWGVIVGKPGSLMNFDEQDR